MPYPNLVSPSSSKIVIELEQFDPTRCEVGCNNSLCSICFKIQALDIEIQRLVYERETILKTQVNPTHDPLVRRLPTELVSRIFTFYIRDRPLLCEDGEILHLPKIHCSAPLVISAVCKPWREIAFSTPSLWATLKICLYSFEKVPLQAELVTQWLGRSGGLPLDISISHSKPFSYGPPVSKLSLMDVLTKYAARWRNLNLCLRSYLLSHILTGLPCMPALQELQLWIPDFNGEYEIRMSSFLNVPVLKDFRTNFCFKSLDTATFNNLRVICMFSVDIYEVLEALRHATNIEKCVLRDLLCKRNHFHVLDERIIVRHLTELEIQPKSMWWNKIEPFLFNHLVLPSLRRFVYECDGLFPTSELVSLLHRSRCLVLEELDIKRFHAMTDAELIRLLESIPSVIRLSLSCYHPNVMAWLKNRFFQRFRRGVDSATKEQSSPNTSFLPDLELLGIEISGPWPSSWESFLVFLESTYASFSDTQSGDGNLKSLNGPPTRTHIDIRLNLITERGHDDHAKPFIEPDIASRLANPEWSKCISLKILDRAKGTDLIKESLALSQLDQ